MEFRILGALEVLHDGSEVPISGAHQRKALALLLLESGRTVSLQRLIEALWDGEPPATARRQVRNIVAAVRRDMAADDPIERSGDGYRLCTDATDWNEFRAEVAQAKACRDQAAAHRILGRALRRWRGPALAGLDCELIAAAVLGMEEQRLTALEDFYEAGLAMGLHRETAGEIQSLAAEHPYRPRLNGVLMLALYRSGNSAAALRVYTDLRAELADELGIEPDRRLRELYVAILREEPSLDLEPVEGPRPAAVPARPRPAPARTAAEPRSRALSRLLVLALMLLLAGFGAARDAPPPQAPPERRSPSAKADGLTAPLWTFPALEPGSTATPVDAGMLVLDHDELRLEADGGLVWSAYLDPQTTSDLTVVDGMAILSVCSPGGQPWNASSMSAIDIATGEEAWRESDRSVVGVTGDAVITLGCARLDGSGDLTLRAVDPRSGAELWEVPLPEQMLPLDAATAPAGALDEAVPAEVLLLRTYGDLHHGAGDLLYAYDASTGALLSEFEYEGVVDQRVSGGVLLLRQQAQRVEEQCTAFVTAYDVASGRPLWGQAADLPAAGAAGCRETPVLDPVNGMLPVTSGGVASLFRLQSGQIEWRATEPSAALAASGDWIVAETATGDLSVWDRRSGEPQWTVGAGEAMWVRGSTLWVLDGTAAGGGCGGLIAYDLGSRRAACAPGAFEYAAEDVVVTSQDGVWQAWDADPWG
ncbi:hypothetical protein GCM10009830_48570 [Glycomyces endophyticus]|uniref:OmpR/PhoB-type domain-containing protein n=1 Tax=Glycomyces endophyticus TaxID=480996 RepID=A0ABN2HX71_9ACTN